MEDSRYAELRELAQQAAEQEARRIASEWHGGQASALYAFASSGAILPTLLDEINREHANTPFSSNEARDLEQLREFVRANRPGMLASVRDELRETPSGLRGTLGKFQGETAFAIYAWQQLSECVGNADDEFGDVEWRHYIWRAGRRVWTEDSFGFVSYTRFADVEHAQAWCEAERYDFDSVWYADELDDETEADELDETKLRAWRHARLSRDADETTADLFAEFVADRRSLAHHSEGEAWSVLDVDWSAFLAERG